MSLFNKKTRVDTLKELQIQKALGHGVFMCTKCEDEGTYEARDIYDSNIWNCEECEIGWTLTWTEWINRLNILNWRYRSNCSKCAEHKDYVGSERPTVLCDACWKIWFEAPKKPEELIQNCEQNIVR